MATPPLREAYDAQLRQERALRLQLEHQVAQLTADLETAYTKLDRLQHRLVSTRNDLSNELEQERTRAYQTALDRQEAFRQVEQAQRWGPDDRVDQALKDLQHLL
jgi:hypothetical protein